MARTLAFASRLAYIPLEPEFPNYRVQNMRADIAALAEQIESAVALAAEASLTGIAPTSASTS